MKYVHYAADRVVVDDEIAEALLQMAAVMARADDAQVVSIPALRGGEIERFEVVIGPATHISVHDGPESSGPSELHDEEALERIRALIRRDSPAPVRPSPRTEHPLPEFEIEI